MLIRRARRDDSTLHRIADLASIELMEASAYEIVTWAAREFGHGVTVASSMQDTTLPAFVSELIPGVDVTFLDTGYHFADTLATRDEVERRLDVNIVDVRPAQTVAEQNETWGRDLFARDPASCCWMRKVEPLRQHLAGYEAWMSGIRRDEGGTRADAPVVEWDERNRVVKINPFVGWTADDVAAYAQQHDLPYNRLLDLGFASIGCAPCTRAVGPGESERAGRWSGFDQTECGLHA